MEQEHVIYLCLWYEQTEKLNFRFRAPEKKDQDNAEYLQHAAL